MDDQLLVRLYNVGLGDCIYLRIPDVGGARHVLIDCGNRFAPAGKLAAAIKDLERRLPGPEAPGKKRLDLLVATHNHLDHTRGFEAQRFANLKIENIWLSVAMKPDHDGARGMRSLQQLTRSALARLRASSSPALSELATSLLTLSKAEALKVLQKELPAVNEIDPVYVHTETEAGVLKLFKDETTCLRVLAPMADIDGIYLGRKAKTLENEMKGFGAAGDDALGGQAVPPGEGRRPKNISARDFLRLTERLRCNALALALEEGHLVNNTSVVLLLEWQGRRLLFTGDAEFKTAHGGRFREGTSNGSWNVMWAHQKEHLGRPLDFLKVGHHGSENATPWTTAPHPINAILDTLLPLPTGDGEPTAKAVVSTARSGYKTIPDPALMEELGRRVANSRDHYKESRDQGYFVDEKVPQPQRTDLECQVADDQAKDYVDVTFAPAE